MSATVEPQRPTDWHVSPVVDVLAYHFSWLWILVPLLIIGHEGAPGWFAVWAVGMTLGFTHRHFTMPYVYLDRQVFLQHWPRFVVVPAWLFAGFLATPLGWSWKVPAGFFGPADALAFAAMVFAGVHAWWLDRHGHSFSRPALLAGALLPFVPLIGALIGAPAHAAVVALVLVGSVAAVATQSRDALRGHAATVGVALLAAIGLASMAVTAPAHAAFPFKLVISAVAVFSGAWNVWHVYMQKFGILRMYAAKSQVPPEKRPPPWVDRLFVFGWVPLYFVVLSEVAKPLLAKHYASTKPWLFPLADVMIAGKPVLLPLGLLLAAASMAIWVFHEYRSYGLTNRARVSMALGTTGLNASFLFVPPVLAYMAYGVSHALEYMVFVWAFQRKRYAAPLAHDPLLGRLLQHPWLAYGALLGIVGGLGFWLDFGDDVGLAPKPFVILGTKAGSWLFYWTIWHSMAHFYFDGFLWKMRLPQVRQSL